MPMTSADSTMYASMGISSIGAIATAFGSASAAQAKGEYDSSIARTNALIAAFQARQARETGDVEASREDLKTQQTVASLRTAAGASGTDVNSGSNALVRNSVEGVGKIDELTIRNNAARQAWGYETEGLEDTFRGQFATLTAKAQTSQSLLAGGLQAIEGPLAIESNYLRWSRYMGGGAGSTSKVPFPGKT